MVTSDPILIKRSVLLCDWLRGDEKIAVFLKPSDIDGAYNYVEMLIEVKKKNMAGERIISFLREDIL